MDYISQVRESAGSFQDHFEMKKHRVEDPFVDVEDEEFLSQIAAAEAEALSGKRRKTAADDGAEGLYTAALKGSKSLLWQQHQQKGSAFNSGFSGGSDGGAAGGGGDSCFKCGKSGHWARDCNAASIGGAEASLPEKPCPCGLGACLVLTANTEKNRGRKFYKCPNREENGGCGFFEWCDNSPNNNTMTGRIQNCTPASSFPDIACPCGAGSCLVLTAKTGKNIGEQFYKCPADQASSCGFFKWCNEKTIAGAAPASGPKFVNNTSDTSNKTYAVKAGSSCFKCGKEGHWANNCPITSSDTYTGSGGKSTSSGTGRSCFKCGKEGHWANDCPVPSSNTYAGSGGKSTSPGTCYKCGKPGHWARECPQ